MRMWEGVEAVELCRQHLLGEHLEMHMFASTIREGKSIKGYIRNGLVNPQRIRARHDILAAEMRARGYKHASPMDFNSDHLEFVQVPIVETRNTLFRRCENCRRRIK